LAKLPHNQQNLAKKWQDMIISRSNMQWPNVARKGQVEAYILGAGFGGAPTHFAVK